METFLLKDIDNPNSANINFYINNQGGYQSLQKALAMSPAEVIDMVRKANLRGRGGVGFSAGMKWYFCSLNKEVSPKYLIANADEGEPGTFKDRAILEKRPHLLIEGMVIAGYSFGAEYGYIYLRGEYPKAKEIVNKAIQEAYHKGYLGDNILGKGIKFHITVHQGAGAYICGEASTLLESLEGRRGHPRIPYYRLANVGAWGKPTIVNNIETLSNVPLIIKIGPEEYTQIGPAKSPGPKLYSISGHVNKPGLYELPMGTSLRELIYKHAGGIRENRKLKAVIPGGISTPVLPPDKIDCAMDFDSMRNAGSWLGSGAVIVMDDTTCMVKILWRALKFFEHESCGKCVPCREGTGWMRNIVERIEDGKGTDDDIDLLMDIVDNIKDKAFCPLVDGAVT
ncbi:MAG: NADH-quinone oxidoreductase subunit NuoF, partial [Nitrospirota bacterium]|nr:NADH-quinone oxidoreductase subunit NuoF [Nitrospirota bacterium]